jgi:hypothetical protein
MKTQILKRLYSLLLFFPGIIAAQDVPATTQSYWVVERNEKGSHVYIYDAQHQIVYQEFFKGKRIDPKRKSIKKKLDAAVEQFEDRKLLASKF